MSDAASNPSPATEQKLTPPAPKILWTAIAVSIAVFAIVGRQMGVFNSQCVEIIAIEEPAKPPGFERPPGWPRSTDFFVELKTKGTLPANKMFRLQVKRKKDGTLHSTYMIHRYSLETLYQNNLKIERNGGEYEAFVEAVNRDGKTGKRVSNVLSFTH
jgi:hypothetical protein